MRKRDGKDKDEYDRWEGGGREKCEREEEKEKEGMRVREG